MMLYINLYFKKGQINVSPVMNNKPWKDKLIKSGIFFNVS